MMDTLLLNAPSTPLPMIGQALLFSREIEQAVEVEEKAGRYTAERLKTTRPDAYAAAIYYLSLNKGLLAIGKLLGVHHQTVRAVRDAEPEKIDIARSKVVTNLRTAVDLQLERLIENPDCVPFNVSGLVISQLIQQAELLDGRATQRIERTERVDIYASWPQMMERLLDPTSVVEIEAAPAGIGLSGGNVPAIGAPGAASAGAGDAAVGEPVEARIDAESADSAPAPKQEEHEATTSATDSNTDQAQAGSRSDRPGFGSEPREQAQNKGGAGVSPAEGGAIAPIDTMPTEILGNGPSPL